MQLSLISLALTKVYGGAASFSPSSLFASGEQGVWYDPSDLTTMFQDAAGTTPVTADGQPVGLILDKSKGLSESDIAFTLNEYEGNGAVTMATSGNVITMTNALNTDGVRDSTVYPTTGYSFCDFTASGTGQITVFAGGSPMTFTLSATPTKYRAFTAVNYSIWLIFRGSAGGTTGTITVNKVGNVLGNHASQATAASRPLYKTDGTYHWLQFDGVDDSLSTAAINFTGTDKISVFSGVRKNANNDGMLYELSDNTGNGRPGSFYMLAQSGSTGYLAKLGGNATDNTRSSTGQSPPATNVLVNLFDFAQSTAALENLLRINAAVTGTSAGAAAGTGNFGNYLFYIGQRNSISLPFNGNIYSLIVRGALSTAQEITDTETWVNQRTGAY